MLNFVHTCWAPDENTPIIDDITLRIEEGQFCCLVGPSGAGKTTLLRLAAGIIEPNSGSVSIDSKPPEESRHRLSYVFQHPVLFPWRTVEENLLLPVEISGENGGQNRAHQLLQQVRLEGADHLYPRQLSGGMQSRVAIARALITDPAVLLMDEPFADLDEIHREHLNLELQRVWLEQKRTVLFVTHDLSEAIFLSDRIIVLSSRPARVFADISIPFSRPRTESVFEMEEFDEKLKEVRHALRGAMKSIREAV